MRLIPALSTVYIPILSVCAYAHAHNTDKAAATINYFILPLSVIGLVSVYPFLRDIGRQVLYMLPRLLYPVLIEEVAVAPVWVDANVGGVDFILYPLSEFLLPSFVNDLICKHLIVLSDISVMSFYAVLEPNDSTDCLSLEVCHSEGL